MRRLEKRTERWRGTDAPCADIQRCTKDREDADEAKRPHGDVFGVTQMYLPVGSLPGGSALGTPFGLGPSDLM